jgi:hypothetical protein
VPAELGAQPLPFARRLWTDGRLALAVFFTALLVYASNGTMFPVEADSAPNAYLPASILGDGDLAFGPFEAPFMFAWRAPAAQGQVRVDVVDWNRTLPGSNMTYAEHYRAGRLNFERHRYYLVPTVRERAQTGEPLFVGTFGPLAGLTAVPLAAVAHLAGVRLWEDPAAVGGVAKLTAVVLTAGSVALIYLAALGFVSRPLALLLAAAYGAGTCVWAISAQSLWQQTPEIFFLSLGAFCLLRIPGAWLRGAAAGFALSAAAACRPTAALVAVAALGWLALSDRRACAAFVAAAVPLAAAALTYNLYYFGSPLEFGQLESGARVAQFKTGAPQLWQTPLWLGAAGLLVSPSRGLLVYSPFLAAAFAGAVLAWKDPRYRALRFLTLAVPALWMPAFLWFDWWGGWAYGYRPIVDSMPLLALLCLPALEWLLERPAWRAAFVLALAWSVFVQGLGAFAYAPWGWNTKVIDAQGTRADIDQPAYRSRLWSFRDWQIGYLIVNFRQARAERESVISY